MLKPIIKIGCSAVLSEEEDEKVHGRHIAQAVALAVEQANERADLPFVVEMALGDDKAQAEAAAAVAQEFIANPQILGVVGTMNSHTSLAAAPLYHQAGLVQIAPAASNPGLSQQGFKTFFRVIPHDLIQGQVAAAYSVQNLGQRRLAVIYETTPFGEPLAQIFSRICTALGCAPLLSRPVQRGQTDFNHLAVEMAALQPELIFMGVIEAEGRLLAAQLRRAGVRSIFFGTDGLKPSLYLTTPDYEVEGPYHTSAATDVFVNPTAAAFAQAYQARYGELYSIYTAEAYDAANLIIAACARAATLDRPTVLAEVARTRDFPGASGSITFDEHGERLNAQVGIYQIINQKPVFLGMAGELVVS
ncbi:MAG: branched-chain amino acid ABC transporter substrate-binding protein [Anaerolineae bacterium]